jgi:protein-S-isoprenylcysteine O-methyltransferase Ste14
MKIVVVIVALLALAALGIAAVVLGESDDSPGLQGLGVLLVIGAVALGVRTVRRAR